MKTLCILIAPALLAVTVTAQVREPSPTQQSDFNYRQGQKAGRDLGHDWASRGGHPVPSVMPKIASGQWELLGKDCDAKSWQKGWLAGFEEGFTDAKRTFRPSTADADRYNQPAYWAGYKAGYASIHVRGDERIRMHRTNNLEVEQNHYDPKSYDAGFVAGTVDADENESQTRLARFKKESYEAGYQTQKKLHKTNGIATSVEESIEMYREAERYDRKSWYEGFKTAQEEDTRPLPPPNSIPKP